MEVARSVVPSQLFTLSSLKDLYLSLSLLLTLSLTPTTLRLSPTTSLHLWHPTTSAKPPLLLIHGFGGNSRWQFQRQLPALSRRFDIYLPDLLFFGRSRTSGPHRSVDFQARCLVQAMARLGVRNYSVAGISYGGYVAYRVAEMDPAAVGRVVIMTAGVAAAGEEERREMAEREGRDVAEILLPRSAEDLRTLMNRSMYRPPAWLPDFLFRDFIKLMYKEHRKERVELLNDLLSNGVGMNPIPILKQETLILWGDQDDIFPIELAYKLHRHLGPKARLEVIKDAGHALQLEKSEVVNNLIEQFLLEPNSRNTCIHLS